MRKLFILYIILISSVDCFSQVQINWNSNVEFYRHNSSTYTSANPPIDFILADTNIYVLSQNGNLSCLNQLGEVLWKKKIVYGENTNLYHGLSIDILTEENIKYIITTDSNEIRKYSLYGSLIWRNVIKFSNKKYFINSVLISSDNSIYLTANLRDKYSSPLDKSYLLKYDATGKLIWKRFLSKEDKNIYNPTKGILEVNQSIYVMSNSFIYGDTVRTTKLYKFNYNGKLLKENSIEGYPSSLRAKDSTIYLLSVNNKINTDRIKITSINRNLDILNEVICVLPHNGHFFYEKYKIDTLKQKITEVFYTKETASIYDLNDFLILDNDKFIIVGSSNSNLWLACIEKGKIGTNWIKNYVYDGKNTEMTKDYNQAFYKIQFFKNRIYAAGMSNYEEDIVTSWIKTFLFNIEIKED